MTRSTWTATIALQLVICQTAALYAVDDLASQAAEVLQRHCVTCHRGRDSESGEAFHVLRVESMLEEGTVLAGDAARSAVYSAIQEGRMPPADRADLPRPTAAETKIIGAWIDAGAKPFPAAFARDDTSGDNSSTNTTGGSDDVASADRDALVQGAELARQFCYSCHGLKFNGSPQLDVTDPAGLVAAGYLDRDDVESSRLWQRIRDGEMPPKKPGIDRPNASQKEILRAWIAAGAPQAAPTTRPFKSHEDVIKQILSHLQRTPASDRAYQRYITISHLHNNTRHYRDSDLHNVRVALAKALNSLSWKVDLIHPQPIDQEHTIYVFDLRDIGWTTELWNDIVKHYPYGLRFLDPRNPSLQNDDALLLQLTGDQLHWVRGDWLINTITRSPLYEQILGLPHTDTELEKKLNVDIARNFIDNRLRRAGFATSGVSTGNRLVERHSSAFGYYWKSYDFIDGNANGNLFQLPLGPKGISDEFPRLQFSHDGGEIIFSLPNGLQGYLLVDGDGKRLNKGPIEVVRDLKETGGSAEVTNAVSCMSCHAQGLIAEFADTVREGTAVRGRALEKVTLLYATPQDMRTLLLRDQRKFLAAVEQLATGLASSGVGDGGAPTNQSTEPIGDVVIRYQRDLTIEDAAYEIGLSSMEELRYAIRQGTALQQAGLGPLANGQTIKRAEWEKRVTPLSPSPFQRAASTVLNASPFSSF